MNNQINPAYEIRENERMHENSIRVGRIVEVRYDENKKGEPPPDNEKPHFHNKDRYNQFRGPLYRVEMGDHKIYWIPQLYARMGNDKEYWAYELEEQVLVLCLSGDPMQSYIIGAIPHDGARPPVGHDDLSHDKRPWRESVHRKTYLDGRLWEYDRYLHRQLEIFPDGTKYTRWFHDDRTDRSAREKETNSDRTSAIPRHFEQINYAGETEFQYLWDEEDKLKHLHWQWGDGYRFSYTWDYDQMIHSRRVMHADGSEFIYQWNESLQTHRYRFTFFRTYIDDSHFDENGGLHYKTVDWDDGYSVRYRWHEQAGEHVYERRFHDAGKIIWSETPSEHIHRTDYPDGSYVEYDMNTGDMTIHNATGDIDVDVANGHMLARVKYNLTAEVGQDCTVSADGDMTLSARKIILNGDVEINGKSRVNGQSEVDGNIRASGAIADFQPL